MNMADWYEQQSQQKQVNRQDDDDHDQDEEMSESRMTIESIQIVDDNNPDSQSIVDVNSLTLRRKKLVINLDAENTIFGVKFNQNIVSCSIVIVGILIILSKSVFSFSLIAAFIAALFSTVSMTGVLSHCNLYMMKQAITGFPFWYKVGHSFIGVMARCAYFHYWLRTEGTEYTDITPNVGYNNLVYYICAFVASLNWVLAIALVSSGDSIISYSSRIKRAGAIIILAAFAYMWIELYFDLSADYVPDPDIAFQISLFGATYAYSWKSMALSSLFRTTVFTAVQLYRTFKHPRKLIVVPLAVRAVRFSLDSIYNKNKEIRMRSRSATAEKTDHNVPMSAVKKAKQSKQSKHSKQSKQSGPDPVSMHPYENNESISFLPDLRIHHIAEPDITMGLVIKVPIEYTVLFLVLKRIMKQPKACRIVQMCLWLGDCAVVVLFFLSLVGGLLFIVSIWLLLPEYLSGLILFLQCFAFCCVLVIFVNCNFSLLFMKRFARVLYWDLWNVFIVLSAVFYLSYSLQQDQLNESYNFIESTTNWILSILYLVMFIICINVQQGYSYISRRCFVGIGTIFMLYLLFQACKNFFEEESDQFSSSQATARDMAISSAIDLAVWMLYKGYSVNKHAGNILVENRIETNWINV